MLLIREFEIIFGSSHGNQSGRNGDCRIIPPENFKNQRKKIFVK